MSGALSARFRCELAMIAAMSMSISSSPLSQCNKCVCEEKGSTTRCWTSVIRQLCTGFVPVIFSILSSEMFARQVGHDALSCSIHFVMQPLQNVWLQLKMTLSDRVTSSKHTGHCSATLSRRCLAPFPACGRAPFRHVAEHCAIFVGKVCWQRFVRRLFQIFNLCVYVLLQMWICSQIAHDVTACSVVG